MAEIAPSDALPIPSKKSRTRKPLKEKNPSTKDANILAGPISPGLDSLSKSIAGKENSESISQPQKKKSTKAKKQQQESDSSFEKALQEMQEKLENMTLEKEKTEELLKLKAEELEIRGKEQEKLQMELKKLQKLKEFKPTMNFPIVHSLKEKEQDKKKKSCPENKRPAAPYAMWCKDHWNEVKRENPNAEFKEITNILGAKWKVISAEEKKPYEEKYQIEKEAYLKVMGNEKRENEAMKLLEEEQKQRSAMELLQQYLQFKQESEKENKKPKKEKDPLKPKQPASAYFLFMHERRAALAAENNNVVEVAKVTGEEWKNMTEAEKAPYEEIAKKKKAEYVKEMEIYKQKKEEEAINSKKEEEEFMKIQKQEALQLLKKKEKTETMIKKTKEKKKKNKNTNGDPNKPKKPASSFLLFSKEARKNLLEEKPEISNSTLVALISVKWKELSEEERQKWNGKAAEAMEIYKKDLEEYNKNVTENNQK